MRDRYGMNPLQNDSSIILFPEERFLPDREEEEMKTIITQSVILTIIMLNCGSVYTATPEEYGQSGRTTDVSLKQIGESYAVYSDVAGNGITKHLVRSHTSVIVAQPLTSMYVLCNRAADQIWDMGRRLEVRLIRFPLLRRSEVPSIAHNSNGMDLEVWERSPDELTGTTSTSAQVEFLIDGAAFYATLEEAIDTAHSSIDFQTYLFDNDDVARAIADQLRTRSTEVEVRVMYDGLGTYLSHQATAESQPADCEPIGNIPLYLCNGSAIQLRVLPNTWLSGSHVKSMIFDDRLAFIGGMNIGREYRYDWHDMMIRLEGTAVRGLKSDFQSTWHRNGWTGDFASLVPSPDRPAVYPQPDEIPVRFLRTLPSNAQIYRAQLEAIRRAKAYIYIENAYFADDRIIYELCRARKRGVDVRIIVPSVVNHAIMQRSNRIAINTLLKHGVRVYLYPGMSHVKAAVYDGWACVGTANFDKLSLQINRELNLATSDPATVSKLLDLLFMTDFKQSKEIIRQVPVQLADHLIELVADET